MSLKRLWITDFRCFEHAELVPSAGVTVIKGPNGAGKTSLLEAVGVLATMRSFRVATREALVLRGAERAIVRAEIDQTGRQILIEAELPIGRPWHFQVNRQRMRRQADLGGALRVSVFSPDDLEVVQGPPARRRELLDTSLVAQDSKLEATAGEVERVLRHRRHCCVRGARVRGAPATRGAPVTWMRKNWARRPGTNLRRVGRAVGSRGSRLASAREELVDDLVGPASSAYRYLSGRDGQISFSYRRSWQGDLLSALRERRAEDLRQQTTGVGPHRDDLQILLDGMPLVRTLRRGSNGAWLSRSASLLTSSQQRGSENRPHCSSTTSSRSWTTGEPR